MAMVFAAEGLSASEKALLLAYCNHTDAYGYTRAGVPRLMDETGMSRATVKRVNGHLRERNLIKASTRINPRTGLQITNLTRVNLRLLASMKREERDYGDSLVHEITFDGEEPDDTFPQVSKGAQNEPPGGSDRAPGGLRMSPNSSSLPSCTSPPPPSSSVTGAPSAGGEGDQEEETNAFGGTENAEAATMAEAREVLDQAVMTAAFEIVDKAVAMWATTHRPPKARERLRLAERVAKALTGGARRVDLVEALTHDLEPSRVRSAVAVVMTRTKEPGWEAKPEPRPSAPSAGWPQWCGECDQATRQAETDDGRVRRCSTCHPLSVDRLTDDDQ